MEVVPFRNLFSLDLPSLQKGHQKIQDAEVEDNRRHHRTSRQVEKPDQA